MATKRITRAQREAVAVAIEQGMTERRAAALYSMSPASAHAVGIAVTTAVDVPAVRARIQSRVLQYLEESSLTLVYQTQLLRDAEWLNAHPEAVFGLAQSVRLVGTQLITFLERFGVAGPAPEPYPEDGGPGPAPEPGPAPVVTGEVT